MKYFYCLLFSMLMIAAPFSARAQCAMPSGSPPAEAGVILFNDDHKVMQYCNGDKWIGLWGGRGGGGLPDCANGEIAQFSGGAWRCNNGSGLTNLNASNLTSGTVPRARLGTGTANNTTFLRGDGTWAEPTGNGGGRLGVGQAWQDVSANRSAGTSYQNTTGKPIQLAVSSAAQGSIVYQFSEDGVTWIVSQNINRDADDRDINFEVVIPNGWYYRVNGTLQDAIWLELR